MKCLERTTLVFHDTQLSPVDKPISPWEATREMLSGASGLVRHVANPFVSGNADENCNPAHCNALANNTLTGSLPNPPAAGIFFTAQFAQLVQNAFPKVP